MNTLTLCSDKKERTEDTQQFYISPAIPADSKGYLFLKRTFDIFVSLMVLTMAFVPMLTLILHLLKSFITIQENF